MNAMQGAACELSQAVASVRVSTDPAVLSQIYKREVNCAIWQRKVPVEAVTGAHVGLYQGIQLEGIIPIEDVATWLKKRLSPETATLAEDVAYLAEMYACLFDVQLLGIRLKSLTRAMCPRFHVDKLGCRLLTTYLGAGTEYLANAHVDRSRLRKTTSALMRLPAHDPCTPIQHVPLGAVALAKGEGWPGNEGHGFVHRSPDPGNRPRVLLSIDGVNRDT